MHPYYKGFKNGVMCSEQEMEPLTKMKTGHNFTRVLKQKSVTC